MKAIEPSNSNLKFRGFQEITLVKTFITAILRKNKKADIASAPVPQKIRRVGELMHVKSTEVQSPSVSVEVQRGCCSSGVFSLLLTMVQNYETVLEAKREEFVDDAFIYAKSLCEGLEISFEPQKRIRRKPLFGDGSKDVQLSYEDDLR
ncbi:uncharacterized protein TNCV_2016061 [Trichonephila clavipes]|nr:uncharacterized protein TNCV_2016061 [Trichonephila clavipes]